MDFMVGHIDYATQRCQEPSTNVVAKRNVRRRVRDVPKHPVSIWLIDQRKAHGWKAEEVARRLRDAGVAAEDGTYRVWEAGRKPKDDAIRAMETLFGSVAPKDPDAGSGEMAALIARLDRQAEVIDRLAAAVELLSQGQDAMLRGFLQGLAELRQAPAADPASPSPAGTR